MSRTTAKQRAETRGPIEPEDQVLPFKLDDGTDDNEEIRHRRYSSADSSDSEDERRRRRHAVGQPRSGADRRVASARRSPRDQEENEWERASRESSHDRDQDEDSGASSYDRGSSSDSDSDSDSDDGRRASIGSKTQTADRRQEDDVSGKRKTSPQPHRDSYDDIRKPRGGDIDAASDEDNEQPREPAPSSATTVTTGPSSSPSTPRSAGDIASLSKLAVWPGSESQLIQGTVTRVKSLLHAEYHYYINDQLVLMAQKKPKNRTPNYHIFDMTRAASSLSSRLTKKSGNYLGKLRSNYSKKKSVLLGNQSRRTELGAVVFRGNLNSSEPRRVEVVLPQLHSKRQEIDGVVVGEHADVFSMLLEQYKAMRNSDAPHTASKHFRLASLQIYRNKDPVFENGFYRLNFNGRVQVPSVKNFQLIASTADGSSVASSAASTSIFGSSQPTVTLQFGKVDETKFHLDFRAPITPIQAFAIALAQCNL
ncbi:hypothetical protein P43SY_001136 [Pythium insidiosum]|uniref:Tubby C-terminal domain-containing protein n=1 Tax=Pythium insidiosum TaxID=114742 RepID=A0AAD5M799_PYTIN|nr:hypothetical protein P43SY_001136 [Pythium insidiosum]